MPTYFEFFCGGGMVRAGLGSQWSCLLANDFDRKKGETYKSNWGSRELVVGDVRDITKSKLLSRANGERADLAWASFPCQDLSLAGGGAGLRGERSGTFWPFWEKMNDLALAGRQPNIIVLENVCGTLTSHEGRDFVAITNAMTRLGYRVGALVVDAKKFLPHSRPRLFFICVRNELETPTAFSTPEPAETWHPRALIEAQRKLRGSVKSNWIWWRLPMPTSKRKSLRQIVDTSSNIEWHDANDTKILLSMMNEVNLGKLERARKSGKVIIGTMYRRTRYERGSGKVQRVEVRFDGVAGCLRTPAGGSSRQFVILVDGKTIRTRLMSPTETARLMGLPPGYKLPPNFNEALHLTGDGVAVPVVRHLAEHLFEPILNIGQRAFGFAA